MHVIGKRSVGIIALKKLSILVNIFVFKIVISLHPSKNFVADHVNVYRKTKKILSL